ncbi:hypothetical protein BUY12_11375, partial [Staphylococcus chromogenes]|uniref:hypothetical protein n=1 Tax=Staphylococcus chromogenes TaxID=46126 RepID=UPI000D4F7FEE
SNRSLEISIALFSMFATFAGAYLGALIAGKYTLKAVEYQDKIKQDSINLKIKNKTTLAIIEIEGERTYVEQHIYNCIESQDSNSIENLSTIIGVFSKPLIDIVNSTETYEADKCVYIPILRFMGKCNRLMNYERHSFDYRSSLKYDMQHISQYRDEFLNDDERIERDKFNKDNHPYIAEAFLIYTILERELDKLKDDLLQDDIYNSKGSVDAEMNEYRFY